MKFTKANQVGFTIVELMIATGVFAIVLLVITSGVLSFTSDYYKGINSSSTQNTARTIVDTLAQAIQFSNSQIQRTTTTTGYVCAGNQEFVYSEGGPLPTAPYALSHITNVSNCDTTPSPTGTEMLQKHMRLTQFKVTPVSGDATGTEWSITVGVAYGDTDDLFCDANISPATASHGCAAGAASFTSDSQLVAAGKLACKLGSGSQFCDVALLNTTVVRRLTN